jgi:hypothetical protein
MARSATVKKLAPVRKNKKIRTTKTEQYLVNNKYMGDEPIFASGKIVQDMDYIKAHTWYSYMSEKSEAKEFLDTYLKNTNRTGDLKKLKEVPEAHFPYYAAYIARMLSRGAILPDRCVETFNMLIANSFGKIGRNKYGSLTLEQEQEEIQPKVKVSIQDRVNDKVSDFIGMFEETIDQKGYSLSMYSTLQQEEIPPLLASKIADFYRPIAEEATKLISKNADPQLKEGYNNLTAEQQKTRAVFYNSILADCERYVSNVKKVKVTRAPRPISLEKKLKHIKFQKENNEFKTVSISPEKIVGAQELWMFNTKYKTLTAFFALDRGGLDIDRTTVTKFDTEKSFTYSLGKKAPAVIASVLTGGKLVVRKMLTQLKKTAALQERINENTILMKAI